MSEQPEPQPSAQPEEEESQEGAASSHSSGEGIDPSAEGEEGGGPHAEAQSAEDDIEPSSSDDQPAREQVTESQVSEEQAVQEQSGSESTSEAAPSSDEASNNQAAGYQVVLPTFEGPLDLLLHLIQQHELDIRDIPIAFISEKYVEYILLMRSLNIDLASEYLVMAATLAHIKSKMLLPTPPSDQEEEVENESDPRAELVRRLLEYQKYRHAAEHLGSTPLLGRDVFPRGIPAPSVEGPAPLAAVSVFRLLDAFHVVLKRLKQTAEHHIDVDRISISDRINQLTDLLRGKGQVPFEALFEETMTRSDLVVTFLALLEMTRLRMTRVLQEGPLDPIYVELCLADDDSPVDTTDSE